MDLTGWLCVESLTWTNDKAAKKDESVSQAVFLFNEKRSSTQDEVRNR